MAGDLHRLLRDPLLHFVVAGSLIYAFMQHGESVSAGRISVSRADLVGFMQTRAKYFDAAGFSAAYDRLSPSEQEKLLSDYVRQEALYREARRKGLDDADPLVRSRLVQQMDALIRDTVHSTATVTPEELERFFKAHRGDYSQPALVSFSHVFFDTNRRGSGAERAAMIALKALNEGHVPADASAEYGDRFPYQRNYADVAPDSVSAELGDAVVSQLAVMPLGTWVGPFRSPLGYHLLRISTRRPESHPDLAAVRELVSRDALQDKQALLGNVAVNDVVRSYQVELKPDVRSGDGVPR